MANSLISGTYKSGQIFFELGLNEGIKDGPFTIYYENGQPMLESHWKNGRLDGLTVFWDEKGNVEKRVQFVDGEINLA